MSDFNIIKNLYCIVKQQEKFNKNFALIFVYNSEGTIRDKEHRSECILETEKNMIVSSFRKVFEYVYPIDGEQQFIDSVEVIKSRHNHILVYSMAQNIDGIGRRCLIPLLCDFYNLININADFMSSAYSDNKKLMYELALHNKIYNFPFTKYYSNEKDLVEIYSLLKNGKWVFKPNDESASIGVYVKDFSSDSFEYIKKFVLDYINHFPIFCIQEFIDGDEVAVPLLYYKNNYYCPGISKVVFNTEKNYLDYNTVFLECYDFEEYVGILKPLLIKVSIKIAKLLNFKGISRIDFRIKDNKIYIEDIGSNPTVSETNGVNILFREKLNAPSSCIYELISYIALIENNLFIPSFYDTEQ